MTRRSCQFPDDCGAGARGPCGKCGDTAAHRERMKVLNADPEFAAAHRERMKARHANPEFAAAHRERMKALNANPEFAAAHRERMKARHAGCPSKIRCPAWVPTDLQMEFFEIAAAAGEEVAAGHIRRLKHGLFA